MTAEEEANGQEPDVVETHRLTKAFGGITAVEGLTFEIPRGTIFGLIGPSGCGKTTTVRLLTGICRPTTGTATVLGETPAHFSRETRTKIGYMLQQSVLYPDLTVWENLDFATGIYGVGPRRGRQLQKVLDFVELGEHRRKPVSKISGGMQRRLSLAAILAHDPELLFLDEPTTGVDPVLRRKFWDHFEVLRDEGRTLLVTTQYVAEAAYCDLVAVMQHGRLLLVDSPEGLRRRAFGGEIVELETANHLEPAMVRRLSELPEVRKVRLLESGRVRLVVDEASTAIPSLFLWSQQEDLDLESVDEYLPPFDDVFVKLIEGPGAMTLG
jgi:ABC-2 type transport system ATP-binding protein